MSLNNPKTQQSSGKRGRARATDKQTNWPPPNGDGAKQGRRSVAIGQPTSPTRKRHTPGVCRPAGRERAKRGGAGAAGADGGPRRRRLRGENPAEQGHSAQADEGPNRATFAVGTMALSGGAGRGPAASAPRHRRGSGPAQTRGPGPGRARVLAHRARVRVSVCLSVCLSVCRK